MAGFLVAGHGRLNPTTFLAYYSTRCDLPLPHHIYVVSAVPCDFPATMDKNFCIYEPKETFPSCLVSGSCFGHGDMCVVKRHHFSCDHQRGRVRKVCTGGREDEPHSMHFGGIAVV